MVWMKVLDRHDRHQHKDSAGWREPLGVSREFKPGEDGADTGRGADNGQHEDGEAAFVFSQRLPMDLRKLALGDHPKCEREIEGDADVPPTRIRVTPRNCSA